MATERKIPYIAQILTLLLILGIFWKILSYYIDSENKLQKLRNDAVVAALKEITTELKEARSDRQGIKKELTTLKTKVETIHQL